MHHDTTWSFAAFLDASINFKNEEVFILYAVMLFISTAICLILFYKNK